MSSSQLSGTSVGDVGRTGGGGVGTGDGRVERRGLGRDGASPATGCNTRTVGGGVTGFETTEVHPRPEPVDGIGDAVWGRDQALEEGARRSTSLPKPPDILERLLERRGFGIRESTLRMSWTLDAQ